MKKYHYIALFFAILTLLSFFVSVCVISAEADHECIGENCYICYRMDLCKKLMDSFFKGFAVLAVAIGIVIFSAKNMADKLYYVYATSIIKKDKLSI